MEFSTNSLCGFEGGLHIFTLSGEHSIVLAQIVDNI